MKIYIAGKMRGLANFGFDKFDMAKARAEALGHEAVSPADLDRAMGFEGMGKSGSDVEWDAGAKQEIIKRDIEALLNCDAIALLPGWETSSGSQVELALALFLELPILDAVKFEPLNATLLSATLIPVNPTAFKAAQQGVREAARERSGQ